MKGSYIKLRLFFGEILSRYVNQLLLGRYLEV